MIKLKFFIFIMIFNLVNSKHVEFKYLGESFKFIDSSEKSEAINYIANEILKGDYHFDNIIFVSIILTILNRKKSNLLLSQSG